LGALVFYYPFEFIIINGEIVNQPPHPLYEVSMVMSLIFAAIPFAVGAVIKWRTSREHGHREPEPDPRTTG
jgi:hypothetical protein